MFSDLPEEALLACGRDLLGRLERGGHAALGAEWELFVLRQLAVFGTLKLAPKRSGVRLPDAIFQSSTGEQIVVEVTTLSDKDLQDRYPIDSMGTLFYRKLRKLHDVHLGSFDVATSAQVAPDGLPNLAVPHRRDLHKFMASADVKNFISSVAQSPRESRTFVYALNGASTTVTYRPGAQYASTSGVAYQARRFNLHNEGRLVRKIGKKVSQISASGLRMPSLLVLCDADCSMLRDRTRQGWEKRGTFNSISEYIQGKPEIRWGGPWIEKGLAPKTRSLNAVLVLSVEEHQDSWSGGGVSRRIIGDLIRNAADAKFPASSRSVDEFLQCFSKTPKVQRTPMNATTTYPWPDNTGAYSVSGSTVRFPLLAFQDMLTGKMTHAEFAKHHEYLAAHIQKLVESGHCIKSATVVTSTDDVDDDWMELDFSGTDPRGLRNLLAPPVPGSKK